MEGVTIATITLGRSATEEKAMLKALAALDGFAVITADGGSRPSFVDGLHKLGIQIISRPQKGLVAQVKASFRAALDASDDPFILYTEPDKLPFFEKPVRTFLTRARATPGVSILFAARNRASFQTFPEGQRKAEKFMNETTVRLLGSGSDYCYGPILLSRAAAELALEAPEHLGWGWRFWLLGRAVKERQKFADIKLALPCAKAQRGENTRKDQIYRLQQLRQNIEGLLLGLG
jgi:hypothetical protein